MTPVHQLQAVLTCTVPKAEVVLTLVQLLTTARFLELGSRHPQNESQLELMLIEIKYLLHPLLWQPDLPVMSIILLCIAAGILSVSVKLFCISRAWHFVSSERQRCVFLLDPSLRENKVNLIVLEQMASFHVVAFPWLNAA